MSIFSNDSNTILNWEWPANRVVKSKIIVEVIDSGALNRWVKSPSFATDMPDPVSLKGRVIRGDFSGKTDAIELILPKLELGDISKGKELALGLVSNSIVICIEILPLNLSDTEKDAWLKRWECKKPS